MVLDPARRRGGGPIARLTTETKQAFKTTEFWAMVAIVAGILIAAAFIGEDDGGAADDGGDVFNAWRAWLLITIIGSAYLISRGLAKSGSRDPYWADLGDELRSARGGDDDRDRE